MLTGCAKRLEVKRPEVRESFSGTLGPMAEPQVTKPELAERLRSPRTSPKASEAITEESLPFQETEIKPKASLAAAEPAGTKASVAPLDQAVESPLKDVFFDFDKAVIREDMQKVLDENVKWLKANPAAKVLIEGHCDERGTNEYNLGLGERRARAVKDYLVALGVEASRIGTISYGEERPFVLGHDESAWKWNRRAHFVVPR